MNLSFKELNPMYRPLAKFKTIFEEIIPTVMSPNSDLTPSVGIQGVKSTAVTPAKAIVSSS